MLEGKFFGAGTYLTTEAGGGTTCGGIELVADVAWSTEVLGEKAIARAVKVALGKVGGLEVEKGENVLNVKRGGSWRVQFCQIAPMYGASR